MAVQDPTTNFSWDLPDVGGDSGVWGALLNVILGDDVIGIDKRLFDTLVLAQAALPLAGGVMTGEVRFVAIVHKSIALSTSGTVSVDFDLSNFFHITPTGTVTISFINETTAPNTTDEVQIEIVNGASQTINWPSEVKWPGGIVPTLSANVDVIRGYSRDGGVTWRLYLAQANSQ